MYFGSKLKKCFRRRLLYSFTYVAKEPFTKQFGSDGDNGLVDDNFNCFPSDLFLQQILDKHL